MLGPSLLSRIIAWVAVMLGAGRLGVGLFAWRTANKLERPKFEVVRRLQGGVELRNYSPYLIAETEIKTADMREASGQGFRSCAGYIFGKNKPKAKMDMTAPVRISAKTGGEQMAMTAPVRSVGGNGRTKVSFVLGSAYSKRTAPTPLSSDVKVKEVPPHTLAVRTFSGKPPSQRRVDAERLKILQALEAEGLRACDDETLVYGYHDPFITPSFMRRNEVCVRVQGNVA